MLQNEKYFDKNVKYGFKHSMFSNERPNLFINMRGAGPIRNNQHSLKIKQDESPSINTSQTSTISTKMETRINTKAYIISNINGVFTLLEIIKEN